MTRGRCAGCGYEDASSKKVNKHVTTCERYIALWSTDPEKALDPEDEYARHKAYLESDEFQMAREDRRAEKSAGYRAEAELKIARSKLRWGSHLTTNEAQVAYAKGESVVPPAEPSFGKANERLVDGRSPQEVLDDPTATKMQKLRAEIALKNG